MIHLLYHFELFQSYTLLSINQLIFIKALLMIRIDFYNIITGASKFQSYLGVF